MAAENTFHFPKPGQRIVRSVIAVACCFCVFYLRNREGIPFYSALAVLQCIQPYQDSMAQVAKKRVTGTFVGAFWGLVIILIQMYLFHGSLMDTFPGYMLISPLHQEVYERRHRSPHRNYVQKTQSVYENVVYLYLLDKKEIMEKLYRELMEQEWIDSYRVAFYDPIRYPGCANIKIYIKNATRENMLRNLKALLNLDKVITIRKCGRQIRCLYRRYR